MKQFKMRFPKAKAKDFTAYSFQNEIRVVLSWLESTSDWFSIGTEQHIVCICVAADDKATELQKTDWNKFITQD